MISVFVPSQLTSYTGGVTRVTAVGETVGAVLDDLDRAYPGLKFRVIDEQDRVRKHMRLFVGQDETRDVSRLMRPGEELLIFGALSGG
ncbi:MoaD/ThiS family protein [Phenylobacterium sp. J426]|uniref:MoaD/ThiS family protein n=1 Tax=Phenylobacterium sp. J426 TaxID=2898439 RepID=UPI0021517E12|nr:MoaD/ThiS family protein [Phenylobacterium sp. J426]MCR5874191.1 MoaD/ThiS family protein [Phenylobacterium sp. J426]